MPPRGNPRSRLHEAARGIGYVLLYGSMVLATGVVIAALFVWVM